MNSFEIDYWICVLSSGHEVAALDEKSIDALKHLFELTDRFSPVGDDDRKEFWLSAKRGSLEEFREYYYDEADDEELIEAYNDRYPDELSWYEFISVHHNDTGHEGKEFYGVFLNRSYVLAINDINAKGYPRDATVLINWLIEEVEKLVREGGAEEYNRRIADEVPHRYRDGTISRKDYWDIYPELRSEYRSSFTEEEIAKFMNTAEEYSEGKAVFSEMTARTYYEACGAGYMAIGRKPKEFCLYKESEAERKRYGGVTPKEYYYMYADGRDDGLKNVPMDDAEAFEQWYQKEGPYYKFGGHHPWEIVPSWVIAYSIHLIVNKTRGSESGYILELSGDKLEGSKRTISIYLALKAAGYPVYLLELDELKARFDESDRIGIVPDGMFSPYTRTVNGCPVTDIVHLSNVDDPQSVMSVISKAEWEVPKLLIRKDIGKANQR